MTAARAFLLALLLFPVGLATHEVAHLAIYAAFGVPSALLVTAWHLGLTGTPIFGLHAAPVGGVVPSLGILVANNALGPLIAAVVLLVLRSTISRRSVVARTALLANVLVLLFFALNETAYPVLEDLGHLDADVLLLPELNYGLALGILVATALAGTFRSPVRPRPVPLARSDQEPGSAERQAAR